MLQRFELRAGAAVTGLSILSFCIACSSTNEPPAGTGGSVATSGGATSGGSVATSGGATSGGAPSGGSIATSGGATSGGTIGTTGGVAGLGGGGAGGGAGGTTAKATGGITSTGGAGGAQAGAGGKAGGAGGVGGGGAGGLAGGSAGADGGGGPKGGTSGFDPCPATGACKVLPLGDSITDGIGFSGGYRVQLFAKAKADNKNMTFVGRKMNGPDMVSGTTFPKNHEGYSGITIEGLDNTHIPSPALDPMPHIVLLHIGTNNMSAPNGAPAKLTTLIDQILTKLPDSLLVVSTIIPFPGQANNVMTYNAAIPPIIKERADAGKHIILVDQFKGFPTNELGDGVHPNQTGYARMAGVWYDGIKSYLH